MSNSNLTNNLLLGAALGLAGGALLTVVERKPKLPSALAAVGESLLPLALAILSDVAEGKAPATADAWHKATTAATQPDEAENAGGPGCPDDTAAAADQPEAATPAAPTGSAHPAGPTFAPTPA